MRACALTARDRDATQGCGAIHGLRVLLDDRECNVLGLAWRSTIDVGAEEVEDLCAPRRPCERARDFLTSICERVRQRERRKSRLFVVNARLLLRRLRNCLRPGLPSLALSRCDGTHRDGR